MARLKLLTSANCSSGINPLVDFLDLVDCDLAEGGVARVSWTTKCDKA